MGDCFHMCNTSQSYINVQIIDIKYSLTNIGSGKSKA